MTNAPPSPARRASAERQAAAWLAKLRNPVIRQQDLLAFREWRVDPINDAAFIRACDIWRLAHGLTQEAAVASLLAESSPRDDAPPARRPKRRIAAAATIACIAVAGIGVGLGWPRSRTYATTVGEQSTIRLTDGSTIRLDTASRVSVRLTPSKRSVTLERGRALFDVAHDPSRPFSVAASDVTVTALGTRFDVRVTPDTGTSVVLLRGRVVVTSAARAEAPVVLAPGQAVQTARGGALAQPVNVDAETSSTWADGRLVFQSTPLRDAVAEVNRYTEMPLTLGADASLDRLRVNGVFDVGDRKAFIEALNQLFGLRTIAGPAGGDVVVGPLPAGARAGKVEDRADPRGF